MKKRMKISNRFIEYTLKIRPYLTQDLCERIIGDPIKCETQDNGRKKYWGWAEEYKRYVRVVVLEDGETILTAHFDRNFRE